MKGYKNWSCLEDQDVSGLICAAIAYGRMDLGISTIFWECVVLGSVPIGLMITMNGPLLTV